MSEPFRKLRKLELAADSGGLLDVAHEMIEVLEALGAPDDFDSIQARVRRVAEARLPGRDDHARRFVRAMDALDEKLEGIPS